MSLLGNECFLRSLGIVNASWRFWPEIIATLSHHSVLTWNIIEVLIFINKQFPKHLNCSKYLGFLLSTIDYLSYIYQNLVWIWGPHCSWTSLLFGLLTFSIQASQLSLFKNETCTDYCSLWLVKIKKKFGSFSFTASTGAMTEVLFTCSPLHKKYHFDIKQTNTFL